MVAFVAGPINSLPQVTSASDSLQQTSDIDPASRPVRLERTIRSKVRLTCPP
jgi:hypothetical protein